MTDTVELDIPQEEPLLPLVWEDIDAVPLPRALQQLSKASGMNVVLDPRALPEDAANMKITAQFASVPVDAAVRILANMADLQAVRLDNVFYVTTPKRAAQLQAEQTRSDAQLGGALPGGLQPGLGGNPFGIGPKP